MNKNFDIVLFLSGVLSGSIATKKRHLQQAKIMQTAITKRWNKNNPWTWKIKHLQWFLNQELKNHSKSTNYYYLLTIKLVLIRMGRTYESRLINNKSRE